MEEGVRDRGRLATYERLQEATDGVRKRAERLRVDRVVRAIGIYASVNDPRPELR